MEKKQCNICKKELPIEDFYLIDKKKNKRLNICKNCEKERQKGYRDKKAKPKIRKSYDLVNPKTLEIVETLSSKELLDRLGVKFLSVKTTEINGLLITEA